MSKKSQFAQPVSGSGREPHSKQAKIQQMIVSHLRDHGTLDLILPDGIVLEIGIVHEDKRGNQVKTDNYCSLSAQRNGRKVILDSYNLGLSFPDKDDALVFEEKDFDSFGEPIRYLEVI